MAARSRLGGPVRNDATYLAIMAAFFVLAALFVLACDKIIGADDLALQDETEGDPEPDEQRVAA
jgi:hypothetical protein